ncbi:two-component system sensor histidine kinase CreC [Verrucomicrobiaceae bacterium N1E253]|uniref:histidine kinase n=1 Tax=Oceaniferula marina TaxID=2748318 RepID=A0A851GD72_9BACT|nr:two-component system sensor histidine kinase CreC [Oceaniferula marina]NWK55708.1 two-component system sensor histidine kinase CreC [Oceaniferula marina]
MRFTRVTLFILALIIGFGFYELGVYLLDDVDAQTFQATEEVMVDTAHVMAGMIESEIENGQMGPDALRRAFNRAHQHQFEAKIYRHTKTKLGLHAYLTDTDGMVLFDSDHGRREGQDFSKFNDVRLTLAGQYGARSSRLDESDSTSSVLYVAAPVRAKALDDGSPGPIIAILTIYKPQADVLTFITDRRRDILSATLSIGAGLILLTGAVFIWLFRPIGRLTRYAQSISQGERLPMPHLGKGKEVNTLGSALKNMKETLEGKRYVENYVSTLTHELKSPLAAIQGAVELLDENMPAEQRQKFLHNIQHETSRCQTLVRDMVQLAELEGKPHLEHQSVVDLSKLCQQVANTCKERLATQQLDLKQEITSDIQVIGDPMLIELAIANLIENASGFSSAGDSITLRLSVDGSMALIEIDDEGPGAPDYALERAFDRFYSLPRPGTTHKGTGLGLALVREAAVLHKGEAHLQNLPGKGCRASIHIPLNQD